jgi:tetratricopeptide (TPR) repeat protein
MEPSQVAEVLVRMQRDRSAPLTPDVAREVAQREGMKAYLVGDVIPTGSEFVIGVRLVSASTDDALVSLRQGVTSSDELMDAVDNISAKLREKIGESLRSVRADPPLEQVTTSSLTALRLYAEALRVHDTEGPDRAIAVLERAIAEDTTFAMAWRRLGAWATNPSAGPRMQAKGDSALLRAYELRARLPQGERLAVEGLHHLVVTVDLERAAAAYASILDKDPNDQTAINNIGVAYDRLGRASEALGMYRRAIAIGTASALTYNNAVFASSNLGRLTEGDSVVDVFRRNMPESGYLNESSILLASGRQDFRAVDSIASVMLKRPALEQSLGYQYLAMTAELHGRMQDAARAIRNALRVEQSRGTFSAAEAAMLAQVHDVRLAAAYSEDGKSLLQRLKSLLQQNRTFTASRPPMASRWSLFAPIFAELGDASSAQQVMSDFAQRMTSSRYPAMGVRIAEHVIGADIATAAGKPDEALAKLRDGCSLAPGQALLCERMAFLEVAQAHDRAGRVDSAIAAYRRFAELQGARMLGPPRAFDVKTPKLAPTWRRLGELYESKGDNRSAIDAYERFLDLWRNADPELQPIVRQVRERSDRLRRATG